MKVKLVKNIPVEKKHGLVRGKVMEVLENETGIWVMGDASEKVMLKLGEYVVVEEDFI
jgi:hypothetical protein